jgi:hypothetical protein
MIGTMEASIGIGRLGILIRPELLISDSSVGGLMTEKLTIIFLIAVLRETLSDRKLTCPFTLLKNNTTQFRKQLSKLMEVKIFSYIR